MKSVLFRVMGVGTDWRVPGHEDFEIMPAVRVLMMLCVLLTSLIWSGRVIAGSLFSHAPQMVAIDPYHAPVLPMCVDPIGLPVAADSYEHPTVITDPDRRAGLIAVDDDPSTSIPSGSVTDTPHDDAVVRSRCARLIRGPPAR